MNAIPKLDYITTANARVIYSTMGYGAVGFTLSGTFTAGNIKAYVSNDGGNTWEQVPLAKGQNQIYPDGATETGSYVFTTNGWEMASLLASSDFSGYLTARAQITSKVPQPFVVGII